MNKLFISNERIGRFEKSLESAMFQFGVSEMKLIPVKFLASIVGQIISLQSVIGDKVRLRTRDLFACINSIASWHAPVIVSQAAFDEIVYWKENARKL